MKIIKKQFLSAWYGVSGSVSVYADGTARLKISQNGKLEHNKVHKNEKSAMSAWYRYNA